MKNRVTSWVAWPVLKATLFLVLAFTFIACGQSQTYTEQPLEPQMLEKKVLSNTPTCCNPQVEACLVDG
jgi:hypothetical protein